MARIAVDRGTLRPVTIQAACHLGDVGGLHHNVHLRYIAVTLLARRARFQVRPMIPRYPLWNGINTHPRNGLPALEKLSKLLDGRLVLGDGGMAIHAFCHGRNGHCRARVRIGMTLLAFQSQRQMRFVTVRNRLRDGRWRFGRRLRQTLSDAERRGDP